MLPQTIETERLLLRPPCVDDARAVFDGYAQDAEVVRYLTWKPVKQIDETRTFLEACEQAWNGVKRFPWAIVSKEDQQLLGMIELRHEGHKAEVGYVLAQSHWGRGISTEVLKAVLETAFTQHEIFRVWAVCDVDNTASARVLEKVGMAREGILRRYGYYPNVSNQPRDVYCYAAVR